MMQVSYRGGSPLYFWPNHSLASRASPDVELRPVLLPVETTLLSLFFCLHLFCISLFLPFSLSSILCVSSRSLSCYLPTVAARRSVFFFFFFLEPLDVSLSLHRRFAFFVPLFLRLVPLFFSPSCSLSTGCRQIGSRRPAVKFILLPCTATMIAASAF